MPVKRGYVFDANVIVSALLSPGSNPRKAFDKDLLVLHPFRDIPILTATQFLESED